MRVLTATDEKVVELEERVIKLETELMTLTNMVLNMRQGSTPMTPQPLPLPAISPPWVITSSSK